MTIFKKSTTNARIYIKNLDDNFSWGIHFDSVDAIPTTNEGGWTLLIPPSSSYYLEANFNGGCAFLVFTDTKKAKIGLDRSYTTKNGKPGPTWGRNIFTFMPSNGNILPNAGVASNGLNNNWGTWKDHGTCNPGLNNVYANGSGCAQRILQDGWQMKY